MNPSPHNEQPEGKDAETNPSGKINDVRNSKPNDKKPEQKHPKTQAHEEPSFVRRMWRKFRNRPAPPRANWAEKTTVLITLVIASIGVVQILIYRQQTRIMDKAGDREEKQVRSDVGFSGKGEVINAISLVVPRPRDQKSTTPEIHFRLSLQNYGRLAAKGELCLGRTFFAVTDQQLIPCELTDDPNSIHAGTIVQRVAISSQPLDVYPDAYQFSEENLGNIKFGKRRFIFYGYIRYHDDLRNCERTTQLCAYLRWTDKTLVDCGFHDLPEPDLPACIQE